MHVSRGAADAILAELDRALYGMTRVAGHDTDIGDNNLKHYWTKGPGLAKWASLPSGRWTALYGHLARYMSPEKAKRVAAAWFHEVVGYWPGADLNLVHAGKPPRGDRIGPG